MGRRAFWGRFLGGLGVGWGLLGAAPVADGRTFVGAEVFGQLMARARREGWQRLPRGERMARFGMALRGVPYVAFTLEIDDRREMPSANFHGLDCWTFFEICLGMARLLDRPAPDRPQGLLSEIENTRYRQGRCGGNYLDRIHYLVEWFALNAQRGIIRDLTRSFPHVPIPSKTGEMSRLWKSYRYLRENPELRPLMAQQEARLNTWRPVMVPEERVAAMEGQLRNGDIVGIARQDGGSYCSHVGLIVKDEAGRARLLHASSQAKKVILDAPVARYLQRSQQGVGLIVGRPL